jgi:hypothetical protein
MNGGRCKISGVDSGLALSKAGVFSSARTDG